MARKSRTLAARAERPTAAGCIKVLTDARCGGCVWRGAAGEMCGVRDGWRWVREGRPSDNGQRREGERKSPRRRRARGHSALLCTKIYPQMCAAVLARGGVSASCVRAEKVVSRGERRPNGSSARASQLFGAHLLFQISKRLTSRSPTRHPAPLPNQ